MKGAAFCAIKIPLHLNYRFFTYLVKREAGQKLLDSDTQAPTSQQGAIRSEDSGDSM